MNVMMADVEQSALDAAAHGLSNYGDRVARIRADVSIGEELADAAARTFATFGNVHILCNNAGVSRGGLVEEVTIADWGVGGRRQSLRADPRTARFSPAYEAARRARAYRQYLLHVGSHPEGARRTLRATKFAIVGLSHVLAQELAGSKIGVSVLCPGWTRTNMPDNGRNRPARFGGPYDFRTDPALAERNREYVEGSRSGLDPLDLAALVMGAIEEEEFYIVTQPSRRGDVQARYDELMTAFDAVASRLPRILKAG